MYDVFVHYVNMDTGVKEQVIHNTDNSFSIFINCKHSYETQMRAYKHALRHIYSGDFERLSTDCIELDAHNQCY